MSAFLEASPEPVANADSAPSSPSAAQPEALTAAEQTLLRHYQRFDVTPRRHAHRLAVELLPPLIFVALWVWSGHTVFLLALIAVQVSFNVVRVLRQRSAMVQLQAIAAKTLTPPAAAVEPAAASDAGTANASTASDTDTKHSTRGD